MTQTSNDWQQMVAGEPYNGLAADIRQQKQRIRDLTAQFNRAPGKGNLKKLLQSFKQVGEQCRIEAGIHVDLGAQLVLGNRVYINAHCVLLDAAELRIDDDVLLGPAVQIYTVSHSRDAQLRRQGIQQASPVHIKAQAWIGGGAIILPGVTVGREAIVGAGSVVTRNVPDFACVKGNPAV
ncbi:MAG: sugar O-acetyltransferase [Reinekea sp.]